MKKRMWLAVAIATAMVLSAGVARTEQPFKKNTDILRTVLGIAGHASVMESNPQPGPAPAKMLTSKAHSRPVNNGDNDRKVVISCAVIKERIPLSADSIDSTDSIDDSSDSFDSTDSIDYSTDSIESSTVGFDAVCGNPNVVAVIVTGGDISKVYASKSSRTTYVNGTDANDIIVICPDHENVIVNGGGGNDKVAVCPDEQTSFTF